VKTILQALMVKYLFNSVEGKFDKWLKSSKLKPSIDTVEAPIPTTCTFLTNEQLLLGYNDGYLSIFDLNKNTFGNNIKTFKLDKGKESIKELNRGKLQANYLVPSTSVPLIYGGFEDNTIKSFDMRQNGKYLFKPRRFN
jgi:hypothetical protein